MEYYIANAAKELLIKNEKAQRLINGFWAFLNVKNQEDALNEHGRGTVIAHPQPQSGEVQRGAFSMFMKDEIINRKGNQYENNQLHNRN